MKLIAAAMLLLSMTVNAVEIEPAHSGNWYDPDRNGEGFLVEIGEAVANVFWFTYDQAGEQRFLFGSVPLADNREELELDLYVTSGPIFGPTYDKDDLRLTKFGSMTMRFDNCDDATVEYRTLQAEGELELQRLTAIGDLECTADQGSPGGKIVLLNWSWRPDIAGNIQLDGFVRNNTGNTLERIRIFIEFKDSKDTLLGFDNALISPNSLRPGATGVFNMRTFIPAPEGILKIRYVFQSQ